MADATAVDALIAFRPAARRERSISHAYSDERLVAVGWMREQGLGPCLDVVPVHTGALRLYESTGWVEVVRLRPPWLPAGQPDVIGMALT